MKKIKLAMIAGCLRLDGISAVIMNYCTHLDLDKFEITIVSGAPVTPVHRKRCDEVGIRVVELPIRKKAKIKYYAELSRTLKEGKFDICHVHGNSATSSIELVLAALHGVPIRIMHCHNSKCQHESVHKVLAPVFKHLYTQAFACSTLAGNWIFGEGRFKVLPNGFKTVEYFYNHSKREQVRKELNIEDKIVIGHVGGVNEQKNQEYLLKIFEKVAFNHPEMQLLIVGTGPDFNKIKNLISSHPYRSQIILYGESDNPAALYSAMDIFVLPSLYEGLPVVLLEAQISGLPCIVSDTVTREVDFGDIVWKPIASNPSKWSEAILNIPIRTKEEREAYFDEHREQIAVYDISQDVIILDQLYSRLYGKKG